MKYSLLYCLRFPSTILAVATLIGHAILFLHHWLTLSNANLLLPDIVALIPEEIGLMVLSFLDVQDVISCLGVSRTWRRLAQDNAVWRSQFKRRKSDGWGVDLRRLKALTASYTTPSVHDLDWHDLYRTRAELDQRWSATPRVGMGIPAEEKENAKLFEPHVKWITGHTDR